MFGRKKEQEISDLYLKRLDEHYKSIKEFAEDKKFKKMFNEYLKWIMLTDGKRHRGGIFKLKIGYGVKSDGCWLDE
jgi:hypothetical protein